LRKVLFTITIGDFHKEISKYTIPTMKKYAKKYNFNFKIIEKQINPALPPHFTKIYSMILLLKKYDCVWFLDCDCMFCRFDKNIMDEIKDDSKWMYCCKEIWMINSGMLFVKSCEQSEKFFKDCGKNIRGDWKYFYDQAVINNLIGYSPTNGYETIKLRTPTKYTFGVKLIDHIWNYCLKHNNKKDYYRDDPVILHFNYTDPRHIRIKKIKDEYNEVTKNIGNYDLL